MMRIPSFTAFSQYTTGLSLPLILQVINSRNPPPPPRQVWQGLISLAVKEDAAAELG